MEVWDDEGKAIIYSLPWKKHLVPQQQGSMECAYYMLLNLLSISRCNGKAWTQFLMVANGSLQRMQKNY
jgi:hypothetical protein